MKILALKNNCKLTTEDEVRLASALIKLKEATPFEYEVTWKDISFPQVYKSFDDTSLVKGLYGLDGAKQKIRDLGVIDKEYDIVWHFYESTMPGIAYWTFPTELNGAVYIELPLSPAWDSLEKAICHEMIHAFHRMLNWKGIQTIDDMDKYDGDLFPMSGANYQRNLKELSGLWGRLVLIEEGLITKQMNNPQYIIIHHTGGMNDTFESVKKYHISKGWGNIGYHHFIEKNGDIIRGRSWDEVGTHCIASGMNFKSIGICLSGNFETEKPTKKQLESLEAMLPEMQDKYNIPDAHVVYHNQVKGASTLCCGKNLIAYLGNRKRSIIIQLLSKVVSLMKELLK